MTFGDAEQRPSAYAFALLEGLPSRSAVFGVVAVALGAPLVEGVKGDTCLFSRHAHFDPRIPLTISGDGVQGVNGSLHVLVLVGIHHATPHVNTSASNKATDSAIKK